MDDVDEMMIVAIRLSDDDDDVVDDKDGYWWWCCVDDGHVVDDDDDDDNYDDHEDGDDNGNNSDEDDEYSKRGRLKVNSIKSNHQCIATIQHDTTSYSLLNSGSSQSNMSTFDHHLTCSFSAIQIGLN